MLWVENIVLLNYSFRRDSCENIMTRFSHLFLNELKNYMLITFFKKRYHSRFCFLFMFIFIIFIIFKMILRDLRIYPRGVSSGMFNHLARRRLLKNCINFFFCQLQKYLYYNVNMICHVGCINPKPMYFLTISICVIWSSTTDFGFRFIF